MSTSSGPSYRLTWLNYCDIKTEDERTTLYSSHKQSSSAITNQKS